ncbi:S8 family serine peptidase [Sphingomonas carotinifaciens]|uniref:S8 family serine peptidase n=1 Tax=Sphingomonas carotinifaciens TaxID=1166323 RepID=UPI00399F369D
MSSPVLAQTAPSSPPPPPAGGYYMANGTRTADYAAAIASWRKDAQFSVDYSKAYLGMEHAYVLGLSGRGQTIGINDAGILTTHPQFQGAGKITGLRTVVPAAYGNDGLINPRRRWEGHGTHVAGTAAGSRVAGLPMFGNAFNANIYSATANFAAGDFLWYKDQVIDGTLVSTPRENIVNLASTGQVRIINNSWGSGNSLPYDAPLGIVREQFRQNLGTFYDPVLKNDVLVVFSAGNGFGVHASVDAVAPFSDPRLRGNWLSVANYQGNLTADPSTSFCGQTATWCVSGPGSNIVSSVPGYEFDRQGIQAQFTRAAYPTLYAATTVAALQSASVNRFIAVLNEYLGAKEAAQRSGVAFDETAARRRVAQEAVAITLIAGSRLNLPDGVTANLAGILAGNLDILTPEFSSAVLVEADAMMATMLGRFIRYTGPSYAAYTGTSMAAPNVSGFAAVLMEAFPEYNTPLISDILVSSSKDLETPGVDLKSGWGAPQMEVALRGPTALRAVRDVTVAAGTVDVWSNDIADARTRYSAEVLQAFPNDIGGLVKKGGGELILTGNSGYTGLTRVEQGLLTVNGQLRNSALTLVAGGTLGGTGRIATLNATGGTVSPGAAAGGIGTLTVAGNATLGAGSQLLIDVGTPGQSDQLAVTGGRLQLNGGTLALRAAGGRPLLYDERYTVATATGGVAGSFATPQALSAILFPSLSYGPNAVTMRIAAGRYADIVSATPVQTAYARLLDGNRGAYANLRGTYDLLDVQNATTIRTSLEGLAPRTETTKRALGTAAIDHMARFYRDRLAALRPGSGGGGTVSMIGHPVEVAANAITMPGQQQMVSDAGLTTVREGALPDTMSAYLAGGYINGSNAAMPATSFGDARERFDGMYIAAGLEGEAGEQGTLGFSLSYTDLDSRRLMARSASGELIQGTLYGKLGAVGGPMLDAQFSAGVFQARTRRTGTLIGTTFDLATRDNALALSTEVGGSYAFGSDSLHLSPRVALRASRIDFTPTGERGSGPALLFRQDRFASLQGRAGLQIDGDSRGFRPFATAYYVHDFEDRPGVVTATLAGGTGATASFLVAGQDHDWAEIGAGVAYASGPVEFSLGADTTIGRDDVRNQSYRGAMRIRF